MLTGMVHARFLGCHGEEWVVVCMYVLHCRMDCGKRLFDIKRKRYKSILLLDLTLPEYYIPLMLIKQRRILSEQ